MNKNHLKNIFASKDKIEEELEKLNEDIIRDCMTTKRYLKDKYLQKYYRNKSPKKENSKEEVFYRNKSII